MFERFRYRLARWIKPYEDPTEHLKVELNVDLPYIMANSQQCIAWAIVPSEKGGEFLTTIIKTLPKFNDRYWFVSERIPINPYTTEDGKRAFRYLFIVLTNQDGRVRYQGDERLKWIALDPKVNPDIDPPGPATNNF